MPTSLRHCLHLFFRLSSHISSCCGWKVCSLYIFPLLLNIIFLDTWILIWNWTDMKSGSKQANSLGRAWNWDWLLGWVLGYMWSSPFFSFSFFSCFFFFFFERGVFGEAGIDIFLAPVNPLSRNISWFCAASDGDLSSLFPQQWKRFIWAWQWKEKFSSHCIA